MKTSNAKKISVQGHGLNFRDVPEGNIVDLRPVSPPPPPSAPKPPVLRRMQLPSPSRAALTFLGVALILVLPMAGLGIWNAFHATKGKVLGASTEAYEALANAKDAAERLDLRLAEQEFNRAAEGFRAARSDIGQFETVASALATVLPAAGTVRSGTALLKAGEAMAEAGRRFTAIVEPLLTAEQQGAINFPDFLGRANEHLDPALNATAAALAALRGVDASDVPSEYRSSILSLQQALPRLQAALTRFRDQTAVVLDLLGSHRAQRYLVLLQDNLELRPTGGFLGSLALVDVTNGNVTKLTAPGGGSYDFKGQLKDRYVSPEPLHLVNPDWQLQDTNWWPDFPTSAQTTLRFFESSGGPSVDGVIAMTPDLVLDLLRETGPVDLPGEPVTTVTAENFFATVFAAEAANEERPKQILADLLPVMLDRLFLTASTDKVALLTTFQRALTEKHLLFFFPDAERQAPVARLHWDGAVEAAPYDYLQVVDTNIGGGKTDGVIDETISHHATISADGTVDVTMTITRVHGGMPSDPLYGKTNTDYVRVYVPKGSVLTAAEGFSRIDPKRSLLPDPSGTTAPFLAEIEGRPVIDEQTGMRVSEEFGKTVFANWLEVQAGSTARATLTYRLPFRVLAKRTLFKRTAGEYSLFVQKQAGANRRFLIHQLDAPAAYALRWVGPESSAAATGENGLQWSQPLTTDTLFGAIFDPR